MMGSVRRILLIVAICLAVLPAAATGIKAAVFRAGAAKADITPIEWPLPMVGTFSLRLAEKAWDPLHARAIVPDDGTTKIAIEVVDSCYCPRSLFDQAKQRIARSTGIPADHMMASATHTHTAPASRDRRDVKADPGYVERVTTVLYEVMDKVTPPAAKAKEACFRQATESARIAGYSLGKVQRWLHERALPDIDPQTGLYRTRGQWNYRDTAADCYPFLVWAAYVVDLEALEGPVRNVLHVEQKLCNYVDRIPARWDFDKNAKDESLSHDALIFGASEYVKDGLIAIVEVTGKDQWFERMKGIEEDIWKHARVDTPYGKIPSTNVEVNGEQIQALVRLYTMTRQEKFLTWARRLGNYYLDDDEFVPRRLRDHGCEIIGGLGLLLGVESEVDPAQAKKRLPRLRRMFDEILARGCNQDGIMYNILDAGGGRLSDGWGYDYVGNLCYDMAAGEPVYRHHVAQTLRNLAKPLYRNYAWEGKSIDGFADSIEGAIYLLNRVPVAEGFAWVDREMAANVARSHQPLETAELWGTMKLESNGVRTVIIHALMHTRGLLARPWRQDLELGACDTDDGLAIVLKADRDWSGKLVFDIPRHRLYQGFQHDWPRMNTLPEWFTVEPERQYVVCQKDATPVGKFTGQALHDGLPVTVRAGQTLQLLVVLEAK